MEKTVSASDKHFSSIPLWAVENETIERAIISKKGYLKILLKVKNEIHFLEPWVKHHAAIVGYENLIILDNMSDEEANANFYKGLPPAVTIFRFDLLYNFAQNTTYFSGLYNALSKSCEYFIFLDADEYLVRINDESCVGCDTIVERLKECGQIGVIPTTWLTNGVESQTLYHCSSVDCLGSGLRDGKPILRSSNDLFGSILHNYDISKALYDRNAPLEFFVLHRLHLYPKARIKSNMTKMITEQVVGRDITVEEILARDFSSLADPATDQRVAEIRKYASDDYEPASFSPGYAEVKVNHPIRFFGEEERAAFYKFRSATNPSSLSYYLGLG